jgi:hypothetical protein
MKKRIAVLLTVALVLVSVMVGLGAGIAIAAANNTNASCIGHTVSDANQIGSGVGGLDLSSNARFGPPGYVGDLAPCRG